MSASYRQPYLDWLRIIAILGVLFFHAAMPFASEETWHIKNAETSDLFLEFNFLMSRFRMPLLFFISGAVSYYMLKKKSALQFIALRFWRLFIPLIAGMLIVVPPQIYMERLNQGYEGSYFDFFPTIFQGIPYPEGNTSWHHLWFILYLFIYDLISVHLFVKMMNNTWFFEKVRWLAKGYRIFLLALPGVIVLTSLTLQFPQTNDLIHDWARLPYWFLFFFVGFVVMSEATLVESLVRNRRSSLLIGTVLLILINYFRWNGLEPFDTLANWTTDWRTYLYLSLFPAASWFLVFAIIGYGKQYLNRAGTGLQYCTQAVYPFYILHQTVIVIIAFYVVQVSESILSKYLFLSLLSLIVSVLIYHLVIRPVSVLRFLFGMRPDKKHSRFKEAELPSVQVGIQSQIA